VDFIANGVVQPFYTYEVPGPFLSTTGVSSGSFQIPTTTPNALELLPGHDDGHRLARPDDTVCGTSIPI
jgi:hypothetical protein